jgi:hypothetical protein
MFRIVLSAVALAGVLAAVHPAFADPVAPTESDRVHVVTLATEQPAPPAAARSSAPEATAPASAGFGKDVVPVGIGWG